MDLGQEHMGSASPATDADLEEILDLLRANDAAGMKLFLRMFSPGARFLIERKLGKQDVEREARAVLEKAVQQIRADESLEARTVPRLVRRLILERAERHSRDEATDRAAWSSPGVAAAERVIEQLSPVEREALRRCYVLGEAPEAIARNLGLSLEELKAIHSRARAEFSASSSRQANVA